MAFSSSFFFFFVRTFFDKNVEAKINQNFKNVLRTLFTP